MLSKKYYIMIADVIVASVKKSNIEQAKVNILLEKFADMFAEDNGNFDKWRFYNYVAKQLKPEEVEK